MRITSELKVYIITAFCLFSGFLYSVTEFVMNILSHHRVILYRDTTQTVIVSSCEIF